MKQSILIVAALAFMSVAACDKNELAIEDNVPEESSAIIGENPEILVFTATLGDNTKATIEDGKVKWAVGDVVKLYAVRGGTATTYSVLSNALTAGDIEDEGATAKFTFAIESSVNVYKQIGTENDPNGYYFACYPFVDGSSFSATEGVSGFNYTFTYVIPQTQTNSDAQYAYAYSTTSTLSFQNLNHIIKFSTKNSKAAYARITRNDGGNIAFSKYSFRHYLSSGTTEYTFPASYTSYTYIDKTIESGDNYIALRPARTMTGGFTITLYDSSDNPLQEFVYSSNFTTAANHLSTISNFDSRSTMSVKPVLLDGSSFNAAIKTLVAGETKAYDDVNTSITSFAVSLSDTGSYGEEAGVCTKVSTDGSAFDIWATYSGGVVTLHTAASGIEAPVNASRMFYRFQGLTSASFLTNLDMSHITDAQYMFYYCTKLESIPALNMPEATNFTCTFSECTKLSSLGTVTGGNVTSLNHMFQNCSSLSSIVFSDSFETYGCKEYVCLFDGCSSLSSIVMKGFHISRDISSSSLATKLNKAMNGVSFCTVYYSALPDGSYTDVNCYNVSAHLATYGGTAHDITWNTGRP